jgi:hypothetical protein
MTTPFIENSTTIWSVQGTGPYNVVYSHDNGDSWQTLTQMDSDVTQLPASLFVHPSGNIFISESVDMTDPQPLARILRLNRQSLAFSTQVTLDPYAMVLPWGWAMDAQGNLYAGQYGHLTASCNVAPPTVSYIWKVAGASGNPADNNKSNWSWTGTTPWTAVAPYVSSANCFSPDGWGWLNLPGTSSDRHIHNLRFDSWHGEFVINAGDNPKNTFLWDGDMSDVPQPVPADSFAPSDCQDPSYDYSLTGYTGCAPQNDALYVGDDWSYGCAPSLSSPWVRDNRIRQYQWVNGVLQAPVTVLAMSSLNGGIWNTPIFDLHATSDQLNLFFVTTDENRPDLTPAQTQHSGIHRLSRSSPGQPFTQASFTNLLDSNSSQYAWAFIATDQNSQVPAGMNYIFVQSEMQPTTVIRIWTPQAWTDSPTSLVTNGATLNGVVSAFGFPGLPTTVSFEYGLTTSYSACTTGTQTSGDAVTRVSQRVTNLAPLRMYHYRVRTDNALGTFYGTDVTFLSDASLWPSVAQ